MGKGDKKTRKGKIANGTFGRTRPHKPKKAAENADSGKEKSNKKNK